MRSGVWNRFNPSYSPVVSTTDCSLAVICVFVFLCWALWLLVEVFYAFCPVCGLTVVPIVGPLWQCDHLDRMDREKKFCFMSFCYIDVIRPCLFTLPLDINGRPCSSWPGTIADPHWLELSMSRTNFHGPKDDRAIGVRLYLECVKLKIKTKIQTFDFLESIIKIQKIES